MTSSYQRPGVYLNETLQNLNASTGLPADAVATFVGAGNRGPSTPTTVNNWSDFATLFGDFTQSPFLAQAVWSYFAQGAGPCLVARVAGSGAQVASRVLSDSASPALPTLSVSAASGGAWGNSIYLDIIAGYVAGRFDLVVKYGGVAATSVVETFPDLSMDQNDQRYAPAIINATSRYVVVTDLDSPTAAPGNAPSVQSGVALGTGADGAAPVAADYEGVLNALTAIEVPLVLNLPGVSDTATINNTITLAQSTNSIFLVVDPPQGDDAPSVLAYAATLTPTSFAAVYYPWVVTNDPTRLAPGVTKTAPPGGAVVGQFITTDASVGPFKTPAGTKTTLSGVVKLERNLLPSDYNSLNASNPPVNVIRPVAGSGICIFAGRTLKGGYADKYVAIRRSLIFIERSLQNITKFACFEPNDANLQTKVKATVDSFLNDYFSRGGLRGATPDQAFYSVCDSTNNSLTDIQNGQLNIEVGVALQYPTEFIVIRLGQYEGGTSTSTTSLS